MHPKFFQASHDEHLACIISDDDDIGSLFNQRPGSARIRATDLNVPWRPELYSQGKLCFNQVYFR